MAASSRAAVEGKCITADLTAERPEIDPSNSSIELCFEEQPVIVFQTGEADLFNHYPCVGVSSSPCTSADSLEVRIAGGSAAQDAGIPLSNAILSPEKVIVHVPDLPSRTFDSTVNSVDRDSVTWVTKRSSARSGVEITLSLAEFNDELSDWNNIVRSMSLRGVIDAEAVDQVCDQGDPSPPCAPGRMKIRFTRSGNVFFDPNPTHTRAPLSINASRNPSAIFAEFEKLGTYVVEYTATATRTDTTTYPDGFTGTGTYTFHVGPIAELGVQDGGIAPGLEAGQYAITVLALNNGPDFAPDAEVSIDLSLPDGVTVASHFASAGHYSNGLWDIGKLQHKDYYHVAGRRLEGEDLTFILEGANAAAATATATIANTQDYSVVIVGETHSTHYLDYIEENNTATIEARSGTGAEPPGTPRNLRTHISSQPSFAMVQWDEVEEVNGLPVSHYEVSASQVPCREPGRDDAGVVVPGTIFVDDNISPNHPRCYYARAVNEQGVAGYWSKPQADVTPAVSFADSPAESTASEGDGTINLTIELDPAPHANIPINFTYTSGDPRATEGEDFRITGGSGGSGTVTARRGQDTVDIPVRLLDDRLSEGDELLVLTLSGGEGYVVDPFGQGVYTLTITDNDGPGAQFSDAAQSVGENYGTYNATIALDPAPTSDITIGFSIGGSATAGVNEDYTIPNRSGRSGTVTALAGARSVDIPIAIRDDNDDEGDETVTLTLKNSSDYTVGAQGTHTLTIEDNDRPRASFDGVSSTCTEGNTCEVRVDLDRPAPNGGLTLKYGVESRSTATRGQDFTIQGFGSVDVDPGDRFANIPVEVIDDKGHEPLETVVLKLMPDSSYAGSGEYPLSIPANDEPRVSVAASASSMKENGSAKIKLNLEPAPHSGLTISYRVHPNSTATATADYTLGGTAGQVTVPAGRSSVDITVTGVNDRHNEGDETVIIELSPGTGYSIGTDRVHTLTIRDDDAPTVQFGSLGVQRGEGAGTVNVTIALDRMTSANLPVTYGISGSAANGSDYDRLSGTVTIPANGISVDIPIVIRDDDLNEGDEMVILTLSTGVGYSVGSRSVYTLTITDNDVKANTPVASVCYPNNECDDVTVHEGGQHYPGLYVDGGALSADLSITIEYVGGTATPGEDFRGIPNFPTTPGETFTVTAKANSADSGGVTYARMGRTRWIEDGKSEGSETIKLRLLNGPGYTVSGPTEFTITIRD